MWDSYKRRLDGGLALEQDTHPHVFADTMAPKHQQVARWFSCIQSGSGGSSVQIHVLS